MAYVRKLKWYMKDIDYTPTLKRSVKILSHLLDYNEDWNNCQFEVMTQVQSNALKQLLRAHGWKKKTLSSGIRNTVALGPS